MRRTMVIRNGQNAMKAVELREQGIEVNAVERTNGTGKPYSNPRLIVHGTLQEITNNVGNGFLDFPQGSSIAG